MTLTENERVILANQYLILEALYPDDAECYQEKCKIVESGYEMEYCGLNTSIIENRLSSEDCAEVKEILDMHRAMHDSFKGLQDSDGIEENELQFNGFDGNDGSGRCDYARFLIVNKGLWQEVLEGRPNFDMNSHGMKMGTYHRMLNAWKELGKKHELTCEEIKQIITLG